MTAPMNAAEDEVSTFVFLLVVLFTLVLELVFFEVVEAEALLPPFEPLDG